MKKRTIIVLTALLMLFGASVKAQKLSVMPIEAIAGGQATLTINLSNPSESTALQFNLQLPANVTINQNGCTLGASAKNHTLSVNRMDSDDYLFVLYNMDLQPFTESTLLTVPVSIGDDAKSGNGTIYTFHSSKSDAVSQQFENTSFAITITGNTAVKGIAVDGKKNDAIYNLNGQQIASPQKGINIVSGRKVVKN